MITSFIDSMDGDGSAMPLFSQLASSLTGLQNDLYDQCYSQSRTSRPPCWSWWLSHKSTILWASQLNSPWMARPYVWIYAQHGSDPFMVHDWHDYRINWMTQRYRQSCCLSLVGWIQNVDSSKFELIWQIQFCAKTWACVCNWQHMPGLFDMWVCGIISVSYCQANSHSIRSTVV